MGAVASQITSLTIVCWTVYSVADQIKHQSSASLAFVRGSHRGPVNSRHKWPVTRKMFPSDDVTMSAVHRHDMETLSASLALWGALINVELRYFLCFQHWKILNKQSSCRWCETLWRSRDATIMPYMPNNYFLNSRWKKKMHIQDPTQVVIIRHTEMKSWHQYIETLINKNSTFIWLIVWLASDRGQAITWADVQCWRSAHDDVIKWTHFPRYWPFVWGIHRSQRPVKRSFDVFFDLRLNQRLSITIVRLVILRRNRAHCDVIVMMVPCGICIGHK